MKPIVIVVSLLVNVVLLAAFAFRPALLPPELANFFQRDDARPGVVDPTRLPPRETPSTKAGAPSTDLSTLLATDDLSVLISRLRAGGFPNSAIRAVIEAKVNERYQA